MQYYHANFTTSGGEYPVPPEFETSTMWGWTDYSASTANKYITFDA
jgi:hypothetical protein